MIHILLYEAPADDPFWINHIVKNYDPPYSHIDVQFENNMASSVYQNETVYFRQRRFKKPGYKRITLSVDQAGYNRAYTLCQTRANEGYQFDFYGMYSLPFPSAVLFDRDKKTFCSKHVAEVLQTAGVRAMGAVVPREMTPSAVYRALEGLSIYHADVDVVARLRI